MPKKYSTLKSTLEHEIEHKLCIEVTKLGHLCLKFVSPGFAGVPDRMILLNGGGTIFVECKAPGKALRRTQPRVLKLLQGMGHQVEVIDTFAQIDQLVARLAA